MAKDKEKVSKNKSAKEKKADEEIDKDISFLIKNLKEKTLSSEKKGESELEEELEENLKDFEFHSFMKSSNSSEERTPVLERIASSAPRPIFVGGMPQSNQTSSKKEEENGGDLKYISSSSEKNEPKYTASPGQIYIEPQNINLNEVGRRPESSSQKDQEAFFIKPHEFRTEPRIEERPWQLNRFDMEKIGREKEEPKYKFKIPK